MISNLNLEDLDKFNELGNQINKKFDKLFILGDILKSNIDYVYGYYESNELIGFIHVNRLYENVDIINIIVNDEYRNKGIGTKLLNYVVENFKDINSLMLEVNENNKVAINFYLKNGFGLINRRKHYYGNEDALIMKRDV